MADNSETPEPFSLKRWSQRKRAAERMAPAKPFLPAEANAVAPTQATTAIADPAPVAVPEEASLPPVESLTFESDYSAFMQPTIAEATKRAALRKLFSDPSFNVMDGLDIYVGDYTQPDPMPSGMLQKLNAAYAMLDPAERARDEQAAADGLSPAADPPPAASIVDREDVAISAASDHSPSTPSAADAVPPKPGAERQ